MEVREKRKEEDRKGIHWFLISDLWERLGLTFPQNASLSTRRFTQQIQTCHHFVPSTWFIWCLGDWRYFRFNKTFVAPPYVKALPHKDINPSPNQGEKQRTTRQFSVTIIISWAISILCTMICPHLFLRFDPVWISYFLWATNPIAFYRPIRLDCQSNHAVATANRQPLFTLSYKSGAQESARNLPANKIYLVGLVVFQ